MTDGKPPPSVHEKKALTAKRSADSPSPAPQPRPAGMGLSHAERMAHWERHKASYDREKRIQEIEKAISKTRSVAKEGFDRAR